jgi:hypothetical protein
MEKQRRLQCKALQRREEKPLAQEQWEAMKKQCEEQWKQ